MTEYSPAKTGEYPSDIQNHACLIRIINTMEAIASIWHGNRLRYLSVDIICSSKVTVFLEIHVRSWKTVCFSEQIMSTDKYLSMFLCQMETIVYLYHALQIW